ncbi:hypothetical protein QOZ80_1AG0009460 [Eleusine coracana subsp. coracana]|nr:hypothetical protein QOZ80_1AG0009460 [Eleusine coracana subsp. coracana]
MLSSMQFAKLGLGWHEANAIGAQPFMSPSLGLIGLATASIAVTLVVSEPPPGLDNLIYFLFLWGVLLAGVIQVGTSVWLADDVARNRRAAWSKKKVVIYASAVQLVVALLLSVASLLSW